MGDHRMRIRMQKDVEPEESKVKTRQRNQEREKVKAQGVEHEAIPTGLRETQAAPTLERTAILLSNERLAGASNNGQLAKAMASLQKKQGNAFVQKVVRRLQATAENESQEESLERTVQDLQQRKGPGHPLEGETRQEMESTLGHDLGGVRLHTDPAAGKAAQALDAKAFTMGTDVFFSEKQADDLSSSDGKALLAHELTHVVQQSQGELSLSGNKVKMGQVGDTYEQEADTIAEGVVRGEQPLQRQAEEEEEELQVKSDTAEVQRQEEEEELMLKADRSEIQRQPIEEEEEELQAKSVTTDLQRQPMEEEEEELMMKADHSEVQRQAEEGEEVAMTGTEQAGAGTNEQLAERQAAWNVVMGLVLLAQNQAQASPPDPVLVHTTMTQAQSSARSYGANYPDELERESLILAGHRLQDVRNDIWAAESGIEAVLPGRIDDAYALVSAHTPQAPTTGPSGGHPGRTSAPAYFP